MRFQCWYLHVLIPYEITFFTDSELGAEDSSQLPHDVDAPGSLGWESECFSYR